MTPEEEKRLKDIRDNLYHPHRPCIKFLCDLLDRQAKSIEVYKELCEHVRVAACGPNHSMGSPFKEVDALKERADKAKEEIAELQNSLDEAREECAQLWARLAHARGGVPWEDPRLVQSAYPNPPEWLDTEHALEIVREIAGVNKDD